MEKSISNILSRVDELKREIMELQSKLSILDDKMKFEQELERQRKEIKCLNHTIDEQECEISYLRRNNN